MRRRVRRVCGVRCSSQHRVCLCVEVFDARQRLACSGVLCVRVARRKQTNSTNEACTGTCFACELVLLLTMRACITQPVTEDEVKRFEEGRLRYESRRLRRSAQSTGKKA
jgi:hypothetical protein